MSKYSRFLFALAMLASIVLLVACGPPPQKEVVQETVVEQETPTPPPCPPIGPMARKVSISDNPAYSSSDGSSIEVFTATDCETDPEGVPWCDTEDLDIEPYPLTSLPNCSYGECLAAVDVAPDNIKCPASKNPQTTKDPDGSKPELGIDLDEHEPKNKKPEECTGTVHCYAFYQYWSNQWRWVSFPKAKQVVSEWHAVGRIYHLSIYALVELPDATTVIGPRTMGMVVASDFLEDDQGNIGVGVIEFVDSLTELDQEGEHRIFLFSGVDPGSPEGELPPDCVALPSVAEQFTCLFPIGTAVEFELDGQGRAVLRALELGYGIEFYASDVQIY